MGSQLNPAQENGLKRGSAFRICTARDFNFQQQHDSSKRRSGQTMTACQQCRSRKIKCTGSTNHSQSSQHLQSKCLPCQQADLDCVWNTVDRRKKRRTRAPSAPSLEATDSQARVSSDINTGGNVTDHNCSGTPIPENASLLDPAQCSNSIRVSKSQLPTLLAPSFDAQPDGVDQYQLHPFVAESQEDDTHYIAQNWEDVPNLMLDFDLMYGTIDEYPNMSFSPRRSPNSPTQSSKSRVVRLRYYRRFGPTAVMPGLRRMALVVDPAEEEQPSSVGEQVYADGGLSTPNVSISTPASTASFDSKLFDQTSQKPHPIIVTQILDMFFGKLGGHFPNFHPQILGGHVRSHEASSFLLNAIAALTIRFCPMEGLLAGLQDKYDSKWQRGAPFLVKAKEQLMPLMSIPAPEVVAGLLILAWAEFGDNNGAGLWMFTGMAIRMAQDLGFHQIPESIDPEVTFHDLARPSPDGTYVLTDEQSTIHQQKARLVMFWSVFILDVCVSFVTGRPPTIRRSEIEVPIPSFNDMKLAQLDFERDVSIENMIFPVTVGFMLQFSEALELLNQTSPSKTLEQFPTAAEQPDCDSKLESIKSALLQLYKILPPELVFSVDNLKASASSAQSGLFLLLHLFFYTFMALLSNTHSREARQGLHYAQSRRPSASNIFHYPLQAEKTSHTDANANVAMLSCQKVVQILSVAELVDKSSYLASPFTNHCLFVAASTLLSYSGRLNQNSQQEILCLSANSDYDNIYSKLQEQAHYFGGIRSVVSVLEHRHRALSQGVGEGNDSETNQEDDEREMYRTTAIGDLGIVNRYSIPEHNHSST